MDLEQLIQNLKDYGPPGLFLAALISNLIPGFPAIYLTLVGAYAALVHDPFSNLLVILAAGVGAGIGKIGVFYTSNFLASRSSRIRRKREEYLVFLNRGKLGIFLLVVLFASLPLPDDILYIPLGISGFSILWFAAGVIIGKIILTLIVFFLGNAYWGLIEKYMIGDTGAVNWTLAIGGLALGTVLITLLIFSLDWKRIYDAYTNKGFLHGTKVLLEEIIGVLTLKPLRKYYQRRASQNAKNSNINSL
jgi:uncharacterized membrane protein YdjX (TVP38/TMEM64 family)